MTEKLEELTYYMKQSGIDLIYIDEPQTVAYFTDFESTPHERVVALFVLHEKSFLFIPALEKDKAIKTSKIKDIITYKDEDNPWEIIREEVQHREVTIRTAGIEESSLSVDRFKILQSLESSIDFIDITNHLHHIRLIKNTDEIERMIAAGEAADKALEIGYTFLKEGITEQEVVAEIEYQLKKTGISQMSFPTMVLFGDHAGSPHGNPSNRQLKKNELVLFDLGVVKNGYTSDVTRTVAFGEAPKENQAIYDVVFQAQDQAQKAVKPGITAGELDNIARSVIEQAGYGDYFTHRLGHGLGASVHEFPSLARGNDLVIQEGMCFSIEPGIYITEKIGVRIEDCVYVTSEGAIPFTKTTKKLIQI